LRIAGHQPNYLPYLGFLHKAAQVDRFIIVDNVQFVKRGPFGWIHRNRIKTGNTQQWLTVPVHTKGRFTQKISEVRIREDLPWARKHWRALSLAYGRTPFFSTYGPELEGLYQHPWVWLVDLNESVIRFLFKVFEIQTPLCRSSEIRAEGKASELIVDLCRKTGADRYLSGIHGKDYLDESRIAQAGITLEYQAFRHPIHPQAGGGPFIPNLSAIDFLFNCGPAKDTFLTTSP
jgi:hypothetical protein